MYFPHELEKRWFDPGPDRMLCAVWSHGADVSWADPGLHGHNRPCLRMQMEQNYGVTLVSGQVQGSGSNEIGVE